ncbi:FAD-binding domain-containing protein [Mycena epipterygia]|nr:FAD-binding domain-containing protein [Mycena epipterygia]
MFSRSFALVLLSRYFILIDAANISSSTPLGSFSPGLWSSLNSTVSGRLQAGIPFAEPCFHDFNGRAVTPDNTACTTVQTSYGAPRARADAFSAFQRARHSPQWETCQSTGVGCLLDSSDPTDPSFFTNKTCSQGVIAPFFIDVRQASDVQAAFAFAKKNRVLLSIKNTGHDFEGRSVQENSLALWMHNLRDTLEYNKTFTPEGCSPHNASFPAITYSAGYQWLDVYTFADQNNVTIVGGAAQTVGAAGAFSQTGGHGPLTPSFGLAVDRVLQYRIVTPDGQVRVANQCQNPDLFWALRGGGGGTFGVVLDITAKVEPQVTVQTYFFSFTPTDDSLARTFLTVLAENAVRFASEGWAGYITTSSVLYVNPKLNATAAATAMAPVVSFIKSINGNITTSTDPSFLAFYLKFNGLIGGSSVTGAGIPLAIGGRFLPETNFATNQSRTELVDALVTFADSIDGFNMVATSPFGSKAVGVSTTPAWRTSPWHITSGTLWNTSASVSEVKAKYQQISDALDPIRALTPGAGAYVSEADIHEADFQTSFWGPNYPRLLQIKNKYDPSGLLGCWHCIGWTGASDPRYRCYV